MLPPVRAADQLLVLQEGGIVERRMHEDLLGRKGLYATLWDVHVGRMSCRPI